jgi:hypothetical protein
MRKIHDFGPNILYLILRKTMMTTMMVIKKKMQKVTFQIRFIIVVRLTSFCIW